MIVIFFVQDVWVNCRRLLVFFHEFQSLKCQDKYNCHGNSLLQYYRAFSRDIMSAKLVYLNNEKSAILV